MNNEAFQAEHDPQTTDFGWNSGNGHDAGEKSEAESVISFSISQMSSVDVGAKIQIHRPVLKCQEVYQPPDSVPNQKHQANNDDGNETRKRITLTQKRLGNVKEFCGTKFHNINPLSLLLSYIPILNWLPKYNFKTDLLPDIISGCTVLALNIPQGLAYGDLAGAKPINGLYVSLFPVLVYVFFGTSRHVSIGTFSVISIVCKDVLESFELNEEIIVYANGNMSSTDSPLSPDESLTPIDVLTSLCLLVGIIQLILGFLRLGILSMILSDTLISAFVVASSIHVFTQQIFELVGVESATGEDYEIPLPMAIVQAYINFFSRLHRANIATLILSLICGSLLVFCKKLLEPWLMKKFGWKTIALPIDITLVIVVTLVSKLMDLHGNYGVKIIKDIPDGFEGMPKVPPTHIMPRMIPGAILICLISYIFSFSLGQMYGKKHGYKINPNQELIALGAANSISSMFLCYPCCASLSRSAVQDSVGGRTQMVSLVSSSFMVILLLFFTSYLSTLPKCVLACIITMALYSTMKRIQQSWTSWQDSKLDGILWNVTFWLVVLFGVSHGLLYSIVYSFASLIVKLVIPTTKLKYRLEDSEIFIEIEHGRFDYRREKFFHCFERKSTIQFIVFEFQGPMIFINALMFRTRFYSMVGRFIVELYEQESKQSRKITIILDFRRMTYIDAKGVESLLETAELMNKYNAQIVLAGCSQSVFENLVKYKFFQQFPIRFCYVSVLDAIKDNELDNIESEKYDKNPIITLTKTSH